MRVDVTSLPLVDCIPGCVDLERLANCVLSREQDVTSAGHGHLHCRTVSTQTIGITGPGAVNAAGEKLNNSASGEHIPARRIRCFDISHAQIARNRGFNPVNFSPAWAAIRRGRRQAESLK
jgi:hypothetical protein